MKICPHCQYQNREGIVFCEDCGESLVGVQSTRTRPFAPSDDSSDVPDNIKSDLMNSSAHFGSESELLVRIPDTPRPIAMRVEKPLTLGRFDTVTKVTPDLDLTPFGANEKGVSRMHATLHRNGEALLIVDMGSANGTYVNGARLQSGQPRIVRDGDEIRLGRLEMRFYFNKGN